MTDKEKTTEILKRIPHLHWLSKYIKVPEFRFGTGSSSGTSERRIDIFAIDTQKGNTTYSFEIKVSRQDFMNDIKNDQKQRGARLFSNYFYYCTPKGLLTEKDIPIWAGLIEFDLEQEVKHWDISYPNIHSQIIITAPLLERESPTWQLFISALRRLDIALDNKVGNFLSKYKLSTKKYSDASDYLNKKLFDFILEDTVNTFINFKVEMEKPEIYGTPPNIPPGSMHIYDEATEITPEMWDYFSLRPCPGCGKIIKYGATCMDCLNKPKESEVSNEK